MKIIHKPQKCGSTDNKVGYYAEDPRPLLAELQKSNNLQANFAVQLSYKHFIDKSRAQVAQVVAHKRFGEKNTVEQDFFHVEPVRKNAFYIIRFAFN